MIYSGCASPFQRGGGGKNQDFMLIRFFKENFLIGCGGDIQPIRLQVGTLSQSDYRCARAGSLHAGVARAGGLRTGICAQGLHVQGLRAGVACAGGTCRGYAQG